jgi:DNA modification methylase
MHCGDALTVLQTLPSGSVQTCITSPPYWGLRDYGVAGQLGLEPTPEAYVAAMVAVFREVRRVLRDDGTLWLNLGDSYATGGTGGYNGGIELVHMDAAQDIGYRGVPSGLKPKDLVGVPWRVAFALQADGWYLRSDIIWAKPNPMPESVTDRPTKSHEYLFLMSKSPTYFYDAEAIKEPSARPEMIGRPNGHLGAVDKGAPGGQARQGNFGRAEIYDASRNRRSVWTVATAPYPEAHFATFPPDLIKPCVLAGTSEKGCCAVCGAPWERMVERGELVKGNRHHGLISPIKRDGSLSAWSRPGGKVETVVPNAHRETRLLGWHPACACAAPSVPCTVLDPFAGAGTTLYVAKELARHAIGIELNPAYMALAEDRVRQEVFPF